MFSKIRTFYELPNGHKLIFLKIALLVPCVQLGIKTIKFNRTFELLNLALKTDPRIPENELQIVRRYANCLYLFHKQLPRVGKCLARSLALWFLLKRKGIDTELKVGMKTEGGELLAHAWIDYKGEAFITESNFNRQYVPFSESLLIRMQSRNKVSS